MVGRRTAAESTGGFLTALPPYILSLYTLIPTIYSRRSDTDELDEKRTAPVLDSRSLCFANTMNRQPIHTPESPCGGSDSSPSRATMVPPYHDPGHSPYHFHHYPMAHVSPPPPIYHSYSYPYHGTWHMPPNQSMYKSPSVEKMEAEPIESKRGVDEASPTFSAGPLKKRRKVDEEGQKPNTPTLAADPASAAKNHQNRIYTSERTDAFATTIHKLLSRSDGEQSRSMEWLPSNQGFRVLRWDELPQLLKTHLPDLCEGVFEPAKNVVKLHEIYSSDSNEDCREKSSTKKQLKLDVVKDNCKKNYTDDQWVDAFVHQLKSWGFEEVNYGTERGSFRHESFLRNSPELLGRMTRQSLVLSLTQTDSSEGDNFTTGWSSKSLSSVFKPQRHAAAHPDHLHVPILSSGTPTASYAEAWAPPPPPPARLPSPPSTTCRKKGPSKTIRFRDDLEVARVTPKLAESLEDGRKTGYRSPYSSRGGFVSRRGRGLARRRPGLLSRNSTT